MATTEMLIPKGTDQIESEIPDSDVDTAREVAVAILNSGDLMTELDRAVDNRDFPVDADKVSDDDFGRALTSVIDKTLYDFIDPSHEHEKKIHRHTSYLLSNYLTE